MVFIPYLYATLANECVHFFAHKTKIPILTIKLQLVQRSGKFSANCFANRATRAVVRLAHPAFLPKIDSLCIVCLPLCVASSHSCSEGVFLLLISPVLIGREDDGSTICKFHHVICSFDNSDIKGDVTFTFEVIVACRTQIVCCLGRLIGPPQQHLAQRVYFVSQQNEGDAEQQKALPLWQKKAAFKGKTPYENEVPHGTRPSPDSMRELPRASFLWSLVSFKIVPESNNRVVIVSQHSAGDVVCSIYSEIHLLETRSTQGTWVSKISLT